MYDFLNEEQISKLSASELNSRIYWFTTRLNRFKEPESTYGAKARHKGHNMERIQDQLTSLKKALVVLCPELKQIVFSTSKDVLKPEAKTEGSETPSGK